MNSIELIPSELIEQKIFLLRGQKVMLSTDLARLYGVQPKVLLQTVKRNITRFPSDFMFQLTLDEANNVRESSVRLRSQIVTLKRGEHIKHPPYAFTEQGVAMLSSVLKSERAVQVNIAIMRSFVKLREILSTHKELRERVEKHDEQIHLIFEAINQLMIPPEKPKREIGFHVEEPKVKYGTPKTK